MAATCKIPIFGYDPRNKSMIIVIGCNCKNNCTYKRSKFQPDYAHRKPDGYRSNILQFRKNCISNKEYYFDKNLTIKCGYLGFKDRIDANKIHMIFGTISFAHRYPISEYSLMNPPIGDSPLYSWLEDENGNIFDHVDPIGYKIAKSNGADVSMVNCYQRFKGISKKDLLEKFGIWYMEESM